MSLLYVNFDCNKTASSSQPVHLQFTFMASLLSSSLRRGLFQYLCFILKVFFLHLCLLRLPVILPLPAILRYLICDVTPEAEVIF